MRIGRLPLALMAWAVLYQQPSFGQYGYPGYGYNGYPAYPPSMPVAAQMYYPAYPSPYPPSTTWYVPLQGQPAYPTWVPVMVPAPSPSNQAVQTVAAPAAEMHADAPVRWESARLLPSPTCEPPPIYIAPTPGQPCLPQQPPSATVPAPRPQPGVQPSPLPEQQPPTTPAAETPPTPEANLDAARSGAGLGESFALASNMFGDLLGPNVPGAVVAVVPGRGVVILTPGANPNQVFPAGTVFNIPTLTPSGQVRPAGVPLTSAQPLGHLPLGLLRSSLAASATVSALVARGSYRVAENESPKPQDRVFTTYNYFYDINGSLKTPGSPITTANREEIGFEKTFLGGNASIEMRLPFFQIAGDGSIDSSNIGDLSILLKYAVINDCRTGNVLSGGLEVTAPTGANPVPLLAPNLHPTILQPYVGGIYHFGDRLFAQGFSSLAVPTDARDVTILFNDAAFGYALYRSGCEARVLTSVTPTLELHVTTPLNHRGALADPIGVADIVDLTAGVTFGLGRRSTLGLAICTPVTGPKPFDFETLAQFNFRY